MLVALALITGFVGCVSLRASGLHVGPGWDEVVYLSQLSLRPAVWFDSARARGLELLAAPVTLLTASTAALRLWLTGLTALAFWGAYATWRRLLPGSAILAAAAMLGSMWVTLFYFQELMPNLWIALVAVTSAALVTRAGMREALPLWLYWSAAALMAAAAQLRPSDASLLGAGLVIGGGLAAATMRVQRQHWRRLLLLAVALGSGLLAGWVAWAIEAVIRFGSVSARLAGAAHGNSQGLTWSLGDQLRSMHGILLCKPCADFPVPSHTRFESLFIAAFVALAVVSAVVAWRQRWTRPGYWAASCACLVPAVLLAAQYLLLVPYGAPRFLLPTYALLSLPAGLLAANLLQAAWRAATTDGTASAPLAARLLSTLVLVGAVAGAAAYVWLQFVILHATDQEQLLERQRWTALAQKVHHLGLPQTCAIFGKNSIPIAYRADCQETGLVLSPEDPPTRTLHFLATHPHARAAGIFARSQHVPSFTDSWRRVRVTVKGQHFIIVVSPAHT